MPENYYMFNSSIRGIREACLALQIPVTGGNVSFYNESKAGPVLPTPTIGMVGLLANLEHLLRPYFQEAKKNIYLLGHFQPSFGASEFLHYKTKQIHSSPPALELKQEVNLIEFLLEAAEQRLLSSAHDLSLGGLGVALFRSAYNPDSKKAVGFVLEKELLQNLYLSQEQTILAKYLLTESGGLTDLAIFELLFAETHSSVIVSVYPEKEKLLQSLAAKKKLPLFHMGQTTHKNTFDFGYFQVNSLEAIASYEEKSSLAAIF